MAFTDITREFYEEFGEYFVCVHWNGETGGGFKATFLTDRTALLKDYVLCSPWPDGAKLFFLDDEAQAYMAAENDKRPGLYDDWKVLRLSDLQAEFGHAPHPAIALIGGKLPEHPAPPVVAQAASSPAI